MLDNTGTEFEKDFNFNKYWGHADYRPRVVFERNSNMMCVYCGEKADTREHCPSKVFLSKPYPLDLPVVPACQKCNNGFSKDELYVKSFISFYKDYCLGQDMTQDLYRKEVREAKEKLDDAIQSGAIKWDDSIGRILIKLAICHSVYELSEGYYSDTWRGIPEYVSYTFRPSLTPEEIEDWDDFIPMNNKLLPIIGSRVFNRIYVLEPVMTSDNGQSSVRIPFAVLDWSDIQDGNYRYVCWLEPNYLYVRIVISEFLFAQIVFKAQDGI